MGNEANIRHKSTRLPVQVYRAFFKLTIAAALYSAFCVIKGAGNIKSASFAVAISILGAIGYEVAYFMHKARSQESKSKDENMTVKQIKMISHFFIYLLGILLVTQSAGMIYAENYFGIPLIIIAFALCQQIYNNQYIASHLSTFFESLVAGAVVITLELMYSSLQLGKYPYLWLAGVGATMLFCAFSETAFHFYNCQKHGNRAAEKILASSRKEDSAEKGARKREAHKQFSRFLTQKPLILDRVIEFARDMLLVFAIWAIFAVLIITGSVEIAVKLGVFDTAIAVIPILISLATPVIDSQKDSEKAGKEFNKYDPRISPKAFKDVLAERFGEGSISVKALDYLVKNMNKKNGYTRYNGEDYYVHPIAVAKILLDHTEEPDEVIAAALLHDCIEDIPECTKELLTEMFGEAVASYVYLLSKKEGVDYHNFRNMREYLAQIAQFPNAAIIKIADRINNMNTLENCTAEHKRKKFEQTRMYYPQFVAKVRETDSENSHFYDFAEQCFESQKY